MFFYAPRRLEFNVAEVVKAPKRNHGFETLDEFRYRIYSWDQSFFAHRAGCAASQLGAFIHSPRLAAVAKKLWLACSFFNLLSMRQTIEQHASDKIITRMNKKVGDYRGN